MMTNAQKFRLNKRFPQNLILRKPLIGTIILSVMWFVFITLYRPLGVKEARFGFILTMAAYSLIQGIFIYIAASLLKRIPYFSKETEWTIGKELLSVLLMLLFVGLVIYFAGFIVEPPAQRWNISTFLDSIEKGVLIGMLPFGFFTLINYRYLIYEETEQHYNNLDLSKPSTQNDKPVYISSQLKKEELNFYPDQFIFCEANGNYVVFHLLIDGVEIKKMIRNSINNIEQQLSAVPYIMRIHRAFIVNLKRVTKKKGNTLGYQLQISNSNSEIPVSRNNTKSFDIKMRQLS